MKKYFLGADIGTSSLKLVAMSTDGVTVKRRADYPDDTPCGMRVALKRALSGLFDEIPPRDIEAVGFSSQVGTYVTDRGDIVRWSDSAGKDELEYIRRAIPEKRLTEAISMRHPDIVSYPLPRLLYIKKTFPEARAVSMPKDIFVRELTGEWVTDKFGYRGLYDFAKGDYARDIMKELGLGFELPAPLEPTALAGRVTDEAAAGYGLAAGTPVYVGCNDFFAGLLGMGITSVGEAFDLTGTSEHLGLITAGRAPTDMVSGPYFNGYCTYGGTKSGGRAYRFAKENFDCECDEIFPDAPVFLPYLGGERAPIFDENARGVMFGIERGTDRKRLYYAVMEGIAFGIYHIRDRLGCGELASLTVGGGLAGDALLGRIKSELFGADIVTADETECSGAGASLLAMTGSGVFATPIEAARALVKKHVAVKYDGAMTETLRKRYGIYVSLYESLKSDFAKFDTIKRSIL